MKEILANESINKWTDEDLIEAAKKDLGKNLIAKTWLISNFKKIASCMFYGI